MKKIKRALDFLGSAGASTLSPNASVVASGVVPDKPALDLPEPKPGMIRCCKHCAQPCEYPNDHAFWCNTCSNECSNASVPAVTDDEAALAVIAEAIRQSILDGAIPSPEEARLAHWFPEANAIILGLRSAGFLLVRDHTKET